MIWRTVEPADIDAVADIFDKAKAFMAQQGLNQWSGEYPNADDVRSDIEEGIGWVLDDGEVVAYAALRFGDDPTYRVIEGAWSANEPYATLHRVAVAKVGQGLAGEIFRYAEKTCLYNNCHWLRVDTHEDNQPMRRAIDKFGFTACGIIYVADGTPRIAYDKKCL